MDSSLETANVAQIKRQEVEEQGALSFGGKRDHLALLLLRGLLINDLQVRGFAAQSGAVVHDFAVDLAGCEVDETQELSSIVRTAHPCGCWRAKISLRGLGFFISHAPDAGQVTQVTPAESEVPDGKNPIQLPIVDF
jgi:hypothetical protein